MSLDYPPDISIHRNNIQLPLILIPPYTAGRKLALSFNLLREHPSNGRVSSKATAVVSNHHSALI